MRSRHRRGIVGHYYEDVYLSSSADGARAQELVQMGASSLEAILPEANALAKLASLFSFRHDFLHQVGALMADRWPGGYGGELPRSLRSRQPSVAGASGASRPRL